MKLFRDDNTEGYTSAELDDLNAEWETLVEENGLDEFTEEYNIQASAFSDTISRR